MELPKVINNISERVIDDLQMKLSVKSTVSVAAASFSIYAYEALKDELEKSIERVVAFAETPERPVVYVFTDILPERLLMEDGKPIFNVSFKRDRAFRVVGDVYMDPAKAIPVKQFADSCYNTKWPPCYR